MVGIPHIDTAATRCTSKITTCAALRKASLQPTRIVAVLRTTYRSRLIDRSLSYWPPESGARPNAGDR